MFKSKIVSSLEKAFLDDEIEKFERLERLTVLKGERFSFQLLYTYESDGEDFNRGKLIPSLEGNLAKYAKLSNVRQVPVTLPIRTGQFDSNYLRITPGLYPDLLTPLEEDYAFYVQDDALDSLWIEIDLPADTELVGEELLTLTMTRRDYPEQIFRESLTVEIIDAVLPEQTIAVTNWFYTDCLASEYGVPVWSEEHWRIIENFARAAVKGGINTLLTPVFTPPLDTAVGGERLTTQLVGIKKTGERYYFNWKLLDRWIDMCDRVGIKYLEISHLFTQWGALHAPKIMASVDGEYRRIFGWETDAHGEEYKRFLKSFVKAFLKHMKARGDDTRCFFHISDEPKLKQLGDYKKSKRIVEKLLKNYVIMDALSSFEFYKKGIVKTPIPSNDHIKPFLDAGVKDLWTYYCCTQSKKVSNRFIAMPSWRTRSLGMQLYKYRIAGFACWGYNFYNSQQSCATINPFLDMSGEKWVPAGDTFVVYPGKNGEALDSLRFIVYNEALIDLRAMQLCEKYYSHEAVVEAIEEVLGEELTFDRCAYSAREMLAVREKINSMIKAARKNV